MTLSQTTALLLTLVIELPLAAAMAVFRRASLRRWVFAALFATLLSHPLAWWVSRRLGPDEYAFGVWLIEIAVSLFEAGIFYWLLNLRWWGALALSIILNAVSAMIGWQLWQLLQ